jgi:4-amino-4-deoxy-L-arabinose transferase-like glycosyltransferase
VELRRIVGFRVAARLKLRTGPARPYTLASLIVVSGILLIARLWLDSHVELMFDEAYYALWAKHLAWGYFDHPPMVAVWIRLSTALFGEHEFGVRALGTLSATAGTGIIYLLSWHLFADRQAAIFASLIYGAMLLISAGAIIITPDTPLLLFWSIALYALVRIFAGGASAWWWVVGAGMGLALQSKYTALLLGAGIVCAMVLVPRLNHLWRHPMPYVAGALSLALFAPVVVWNYQHAWASFAFQFGRANIDSLNPLFVLELLGSQIGLLTPFVFVLAMGGLWLGLRPRRCAYDDAPIFLVSLVAPLLAYFMFHSLHARVHGNWLAPAYPVLAVLAAEAARRRDRFPERMQAAIDVSRRWAVPVGLAFAAAAYLQVGTATFPLDAAKDPTALMAGWSDLAEQVNAAADKAKVQFILTSHYRLTSELGVYARGERPIIQLNECLRWEAFGGGMPSLRDLRGLYVVETGRDEPRDVAKRFGVFQKLAEVQRHRDGRGIAAYTLYLVAEPRPSLSNDFALVADAKDAPHRLP